MLWRAAIIISGEQGDAPGPWWQDCEGEGGGVAVLGCL